MRNFTLNMSNNLYLEDSIEDNACLYIEIWLVDTKCSPRAPPLRRNRRGYQTSRKHREITLKIPPKLRKVGPSP